jgi:hypothetical protein
MHTILTSHWIKPLIKAVFGCAAGAVLLWQGYSQQSAVAGSPIEHVARVSLKIGGAFVAAASLVYAAVDFM